MQRWLTPLEQLPHVGDIRQLGFVVGIELVRDRASKNTYPLSERVGHRVAEETRRLGMLIRPLGNVIVLMPPLSTSLKELRQMVEILKQAITTVTGGPGQSHSVV